MIDWLEISLGMCGMRQVYKNHIGCKGTTGAGREGDTVEVKEMGSEMVKSSKHASLVNRCRKIRLLRDN